MRPRRRTLLLIWVILISNPLPSSGFMVTRKGQRCEARVDSSTYELSESHNQFNQNFLREYDLVLRLIDSKTDVGGGDIDLSWCPDVGVAAKTRKFSVEIISGLRKPLRDCACAMLRPWITSKITTVYQCDLPAGPEPTFFKTFKSKVIRYTQFVRIQIALLRDAKAVNLFDDLLISCVYNFIDEQIISTSRAIGSVSQKEAEKNNLPMKTDKAPNQPTTSASATVPKPSIPEKTSPPASTPASSAIISNEPVLPISSAPPAPSDKTEQATSTAPDPGMPERNEDYSAVAQQIATLATAVIVLIGLLFVLAAGIVAWIWRRNRIRSSEYQPLVTVAPSMEIFDSNE